MTHLADPSARPADGDCSVGAGGPHHERKAFRGNPETEIPVPEREENLSTRVRRKNTGNGTTGLAGLYKGLVF